MCPVTFKHKSGDCCQELILLLPDALLLILSIICQPGLLHMPMKSSWPVALRMP